MNWPVSALRGSAGQARLRPWGSRETFLFLLFLFLSNELTLETD